jgi:hypothetical protein
MVVHKSLTALVLASGLLAGSVAAQEHHLQLHGYAGAVTPLANLQQNYYPDGSGGVLYRHFKGGLNFGGGVSYWLDDHLGLRADASFTKADVVSPAAEGTGAFKKIFLGGDILLRAPGTVTPYGYFGVGAVRMDESGPRYPTTTRAVGRVGGGLGFTPSGPLGFFIEAGLMAYDFDQTLFPFYDKVQTDVAWKAGISFAL